MVLRSLGLAAVKKKSQFSVSIERVCTSAG